MKLRTWKSTAQTVGFLGLSALGINSYAANECRIEYGYHTIKNGVREDHVSYANINKDSVKDVLQDRLNYVKNLKDHHVTFDLEGAANITLMKNQFNPPAAYYLMPVTLVKAICLKESGYPQPQTPAILINTMKEANATIDDIARSLSETFNLNMEQLAQNLKMAGFTANQIMSMLHESFNISIAVATNISKTVFNLGLNPTIKLLKQAGYAGSQIAASVHLAFNESAEAIGQGLKLAGYTSAQIADFIYDLSDRSADILAKTLDAIGEPIEKVAKAVERKVGRYNKKVIQALKFAGYQLEPIVKVVKNHLRWSRTQAQAALAAANYGADEIARILDKIYGPVRKAAQAAANETIQTGREVAQGLGTAAQNTATAIDRNAVNTMKIQMIYFGSHRAINGPCTSPSGKTTYGETIPLPLRNNDRDQVVTIQGMNLMPTTAISGLPRGISARINARGKCGLQLAIKVPNSVRTGIAGTATLMVNSQRGVSFPYHIGAVSNTTSGGSQSGGNISGSGGRFPDLKPHIIDNDLYIVGSATTLDRDNNLYTALDPFNGSSFCQSVPYGSVDRTNAQFANRANITVPDIIWGVKNDSGQNITTPFTIQLQRGNQVVASQVVNSLNANQHTTFNYSRPNSNTCVARVGVGGGCYHCGASSEGWNDNSGYRVKVDTGANIDESNEFNNQADL